MFKQLVLSGACCLLPVLLEIGPSSYFFLSIVSLWSHHLLGRMAGSTLLIQRDMVLLSLLFILGILLIQGRGYVPFLPETNGGGINTFLTMNFIIPGVTDRSHRTVTDFHTLTHTLNNLLKGACGLELACKDHQDAQAVLTHYAPQVDCGIALSEEELRELERELLGCLQLIEDTNGRRNQFSEIQHQLHQTLHDEDIEGLEQSLAAIIEEAALAVQNNSPIHYASLTVGIDYLNGYLLEGNDIPEQTPPNTGIELLDQQIITLGQAINRVSSALLLKTQGVE